MLPASKSSSWPIGVGDQTVIIFETLSWTLATLYRLEAYATLRMLEACASAPWRCTAPQVKVLHC
jgi:hypothetical protein